MIWLLLWSIWSISGLILGMFYWVKGTSCRYGFAGLALLSWLYISFIIGPLVLLEHPSYLTLRIMRLTKYCNFSTSVKNELFNLKILTLDKENRVRMGKYFIA